MIIAAAYIRVSTDEQAEYSPAAQLEDILDFAKKNGLYIPKEFIFTDEGISGRSADKRPAFQDMIRQVRKKANLIQFILVHKYDRFARSKDDAVLYKALLKKDGIKVISIKEPIPQDDKFAVIYESMLEAMAEYYSLNLAEEVKKTMVKKAERGEWQTTAPYGYRNQNKSLVIVPAEAKMVRYIYSQYVAGTSMFALSRQLNIMGCRTHRGNEFERRTIQYILNNPVYKGYMRWTPEKKLGRDFSNTSAIVSKGNWESIISEELWQAAADKYRTEQKTHYYKKRPETEGIHWLSGMVKCSACGRSLIAGTKYKNGHISFQCSGYNHGQCHISHSISTSRLVPALLDSLEEIIAHTDASDFTYTIHRRLPAVDAPDINTTLLAKSQQRLRKAKEAFLNDIDTLDEYKENKYSIEKEIAALKERIAAKHTEQSQPLPPNASSVGLSSVPAILRDASCTTEDKRKAFQAVAEKVIYNKSNNSIELFLIDS